MTNSALAACIWTESPCQQAVMHLVFILDTQPCCTVALLVLHACINMWRKRDLDGCTSSCQEDLPYLYVEVGSKATPDIGKQEQGIPLTSKTPQGSQQLPVWCRIRMWGGPQTGPCMHKGNNKLNSRYISLCKTLFAVKLSAASGLAEAECETCMYETCSQRLRPATTFCNFATPR